MLCLAAGYQTTTSRPSASFSFVKPTACGPVRAYGAAVRAVVGVALVLDDELQPATKMQAASSPPAVTNRPCFAKLRRRAVRTCTLTPVWFACVCRVISAHRRSGHGSREQAAVDEGSGGDVHRRRVARHDRPR